MKPAVRNNSKPAAALVGIFSLALTLASCGGGGGAPPPPSNPRPSLASISPTSASAGGAAFTLTVNGSDFISSSVVRWGGADRTTTFVSSTALTAAITAVDIATAGTVQVTVFNPSPGGGTSSGQTFTIENPVPTLTSISPTSAMAGGADFTQTVAGTNFVTGSIVRWAGSNRTTTFVSATQLTAAITAADIATGGTAQVTVFNPAPGGGTSGGLTFTITAASPIAIHTSRLPDTAGGNFYDFTPAASGGVAPYIWSLSAGSLPAGLALDAATGRVSGTASPVGGDTTSNFTLRVTDSASQPQTQDLSITVRVSLGRNDACTPGNPAGTTQISNGRLRASLSPYGDLDVYSFQGTAGAQLTAELFAQRLDLDSNPSTRDSFADTMLELLNSSCALITFNDDSSPPPNHVQDSRIPEPPQQTFTLPSTGTYYLRVRDFRGDGRPDLIYDLSLSGAN